MPRLAAVAWLLLVLFSSGIVPESSARPHLLKMGRSALAENCVKGLVCLEGGQWLQAGGLVTAPWFVVFICSPAAVASLLVLIFAILEQYGYVSSACCSFGGLVGCNAVAAVFWLLALPLTAYLVANDVLVMIVYLAFAALALLAHGTLLVVYTRRHQRNRAAQDQPRQQLLTARDKQDITRKTGDEEAPNPFSDPTMGIIPGTSSRGYILWLPTEDLPAQQVEYHPAPSPGMSGAHTLTSPVSPSMVTLGTAHKDKDGRMRLVPKAVQHSTP